MTNEIVVDARKSPLAMVMSFVAFVGPIIGLIGGGSGLYQTWIRSSDDLRIAAAIDVSKTYLRDVRNEDIDLLILAGSDSELTEAQQIRLARLSDTFEYYALLANNGKLDSAFLSRAINCAIIAAARAAQKYRFSIPTGGRPLELIEFSKRTKCGGYDYTSPTAAADR